MYIKLGFKERLNKEQIGNIEPFPVTNLSVYLINSEQIDISEQFCDDQKVPNAKFDCTIELTKQIFSRLFKIYMELKSPLSDFTLKNFQKKL